MLYKCVSQICLWEMFLILFIMLVQIFEKNPTTIKNYGIWLRYQSRTGYHNMYKEYRDTTLNGSIEQMYTEMASRHRVRHHCIQVIKTATIPAKLCKRESTKQFHNSKIKFPLVFKKVRPPTRKLKTTYKASRPNLFVWVKFIVGFSFFICNYMLDTYLGSLVVLNGDWFYCFENLYLWPFVSYKSGFKSHFVAISSSWLYSVTNLPVARYDCHMDQNLIWLKLGSRKNAFMQLFWTKD